jgi:hypothetical protein
MYRLKKKQVLFSLLSLLMVLLLCGCVETLTLLSVPVTALQLGTTAYHSIEKADIDAAMISETPEKDLKDIKHVAVILGQESTDPPVGRIGDIEAVVGDNLCIHLNKMGFKVCDGSKLRKSTIRRLGKTGFTPQQVTDLGKALGVQAIVIGHVTAGQHRSLGMLGVGRMNTVVQSASMKIIGVKRGDTLMLVTINYKVGQNPNNAAEGIAMVLKAKLENPSGDIKKTIREEQQTIG